MNLHITPEIHGLVQDIFNTGSYRDETEVLTAALHLLDDRDRRIRDLRGELQPALDRLDRGERIEIAEGELRQFFAQIVAEGAQIVAEGNREIAHE